MMIIVLVGSCRFEDTFRRQALIETVKGHTVLSLSVNLKADYQDYCDFWFLADLAPIEVRDNVRTLREWVVCKVSRAHRAKIAMADEVLVINVGDYIGQMTGEEIEYAKLLGKPVRYLEDHSDG